jgi:Zn-dependent peptidase ImmA (M78 family)
LPEFIAGLLSRTGMTEDQLAELAGVEVGDLAAPEPDTLRRISTTLGMRMSDLVAGRAPPAGGLFRTWLDEPTALHELAAEGTARTVGGFRRDLAEVVALDEQLGERLSPLPDWAVPQAPSDERDHGTMALAEEVRAELGLGVEPVPSVWALAARIGVHCASVTPDELPSYIDGVSWKQPACLVANTTGPWWRTRMTVAHELAHVLFDPEPFWISATRPSRLYALHSKIEQRANAFAAYLLVPPGGAREIVGSGRPTREALLELARTYAVGVHVAANVIRHVWDLSHQEREGLLYGWDSAGSFEHPDATGPGSPCRQLRDRAERAVARALLDEVRAHALLGVPLSAPLPFGDHPPVFDAYTRVRHAVIEHLDGIGRSDLAVGEVVVDPSGYRVSLLPAWPHAPTRPGPQQLHVTREFVVA